MHGVYKYEVNGQVIYVGKTDSDFAERINCHGREEAFAQYLPKAKIFVRELKSAYEADFLETLLINQYKPELNKVKKNVTDIEIWANVDWESWDSFVMKRRRTLDEKKSGYTLYLSVPVMEEATRRAKAAGYANRSRYIDEVLKRVFQL